jgi:hypothetical protein
MPNQPPAPPAGVNAREPMTLDEIAAAASVLIAQARDTGLTPPCALSCRDYGPPAASLFVSETDAPDIWAALQAWADRYHTEITTHLASTPGNLHASVEFRRDGIRYDVYSIIHPAPDDPDEDESQPGDDQPGEA